MYQAYFPVVLNRNASSPQGRIAGEVAMPAAPLDTKAVVGGHLPAQTLLAAEAVSGHGVPEYGVSDGCVCWLLCCHVCVQRK
jgi:hypothetical protein